jgi:hypothetical protein
MVIVEKAEVTALDGLHTYTITIVKGQTDCTLASLRGKVGQILSDGFRLEAEDGSDWIKVVYSGLASSMAGMTVQVTGELITQSDQKVILGKTAVVSSR